MNKNVFNLLELVLSVTFFAVLLSTFIYMHSGLESAINDTEVLAKQSANIDLSNLYKLEVSKFKDYSKGDVERIVCNYLIENNKNTDSDTRLSPLNNSYTVKIYFDGIEYFDKTKIPNIIDSDYDIKYIYSESELKEIRINTK